MSVIYDDDESLQIVHVPHEQVKAYLKYQLDLSSDIGC